jgi:hypothetical protein
MAGSAPNFVMRLNTQFNVMAGHNYQFKCGFQHIVRNIVGSMAKMPMQ